MQELHWVLYMCVIFLKPEATSLPDGVVATPVFQMKKFRYVIFARDHTTHGWRSQDSNPHFSLQSPAYSHYIILIALATTQAQPASTSPHR